MSTPSTLIEFAPPVAAASTPPFAARASTQ